MKYIKSNSCVNAWDSAVDLLLGETNNSTSNLIVEIQNTRDIDWDILKLKNPNKINPSLNDIYSVINTIFPNKIWLKSESRQEFYDRYIQIYLRNKPKGTWGTYFKRLIDYPNPKNGKPNQLENVINKINGTQDNQSATYNLHLSSKSLDNLKTRGSPCLQYVQFKIFRPYIKMTSIYRSHDFLNKALGNYIGLSLLLNFVAEQTSLTPDGFLCHSIHAEIMGNPGLARRIRQEPSLFLY